MAKKNEGRINVKRLNNLQNIVNDRMKVLYKDTYNSDRSYSDELDMSIDNMEKNLDDIITRNSSYDLSNVTKLITRTRLQKNIDDSQFRDNVENLFTDDTLTNSLLTSYLANKDIIDINNEIDTVCRYMPKLEEALSVKSDAILSSEDYSKDFINVTSSISEKENSIFADRIATIKRKYKLAEKFKLYNDNTQKYGEEFIYKTTYNKAISNILKNKSNTRSPNVNGFKINESMVLIEDGKIPFSNRSNSSRYDLPNAVQDKLNIKVEFSFSGILESAISEHEKMLESQVVINESLTLLNEAKTDNIKLDKHIIDDKLEYDEDSKKGTEGLIDLNKTQSQDTEKINAPGCILKRLKMENIIPVYIDDICLGYYYIEFLNGTNGYEAYSNLMYDYNNYSNIGGVNTSTTFTDTMNQQQRQNMLNYISYSIANNIDAKFVNNNQDLTKEIYAILKHNDVYNNASLSQMIRVSFLSTDDVIHMKYQEDPNTHRGISDLAKALMPAKLYSCLYITNSLGILTRGQDKRVYYVKQNIETNISQTLLNVINQIKKSNFGIRQVESMNTILNVTGRFNDFVIPVGPSGDSPIQFEVMQGQEFNPYTELMESLEEMSINTTDVPLEVINARYSADFATQVTMSNIKFLRHCYNRQSIDEEVFSDIITTIYKAEYGEELDIKCILPTPLFLNMTNLQNIIENTKNTTDIIASYEYDENDENDNAKKIIFSKKLMKHRLSTYVRQDEIDKIKRETEFEYSRTKTKKSATQEDQ